ncbi:hypothetical protein [Methanobacterium sp.]|uniref:hypothetical protein n=1 Tax=Methanobacterium sp. TaxID=2164 RepID=UPI003158417B
MAIYVSFLRHALVTVLNIRKKLILQLQIQRQVRHQIKGGMVGQLKAAQQAVKIKGIIQYKPADDNYTKVQPVEEINDTEDNNESVTNYGDLKSFYWEIALACVVIVGLLVAGFVLRGKLRGR